MLCGRSGGIISSSKSSTFSSLRGSVRTVVGVDGPGVAGVEAVVMIGVRMRFACCSSIREWVFVSIVAFPLRDVSHSSGIL